MNTTVNDRNLYKSSSVSSMTPSDEIFLQSILKRQYYLLRDMYKLHDKYPEIIDIDIVSSLDCVFRVMHDMAEDIRHTSYSIYR